MISLRAAACPACGAQVKRANYAAAVAVLGAVALFVFLVIVGVKNSNEREQRIAQETATERVQNDALVKDHRVRVGMTSDQVLQAWGEPQRTNRTSTANHGREQWIYEWASKTSYLHFDDGVLRSIQTSQ